MHIRYRESLQSLNTLALEGLAKALVTLEHEDQLPEALAWAAERDLPVIALGSGSNIVIAGDVDATFVQLKTRGIRICDDSGNGVRLCVAAGENWHYLVQWTLQQGLYGLENLALIPGTVGAAPIQNIGAYGVELAPYVQAVHCRTVADGSLQVLSQAQCEFGYRDSVFKHRLRDQVVITAVELQLSRQPSLHTGYPALAQALAGTSASKLTPQAVFEAVVAIRQSKLPDPAVEPNAGSFFKNPVVETARAEKLKARFPGLPCYQQPDHRVKLAAAWLIEYCGWKGHSRDGLGVHPKHALVLVNYGNGSGEKLLAMAAAVARSVQETFGIELEMEPRIYGQTV